MAKLIFIRNTTGIAIELTSLGIFIPVGGTRGISRIPSAILRNDTLLESLIINGDIVVNDGIEDITAANGYVFPNEPLSYIDNDITFNPFVGGKQRLAVPGGLTTDRPTIPLLGDLRYNSDIASTPVGEIYNGTAWVQLYRWDDIITDSGTITPIEPISPLTIVGDVGITTSASGNTVTVTGPVFGTEFQKVESLTVSTTTSTTFQNKVTLVTPSIPAGEYRVGFHYSWNHNDTGSDFEADYVEDASPMGEIHKQEPKDSSGSFGTTGTSQRHVASKVFYRTLTLGIHTFELDYRTDTGGDESSIWDAVVEIWRVG